MNERIKVDKATSIGDWVREYGHYRSLVVNLDNRNNVSKTTIYNYIASTDAGHKDIRVIGRSDDGIIYEVKRAGIH